MLCLCQVAVEHERQNLGFQRKVSMSFNVQWFVWKVLKILCPSVHEMQWYPLIWMTLSDVVFVSLICCACFTRPMVWWFHMGYSSRSAKQPCKGPLHFTWQVLELGRLQPEKPSKVFHKDCTASTRKYQKHPQPQQVKAPKQIGEMLSTSWKADRQILTVDAWHMHELSGFRASRISTDLQWFAEILWASRRFGPIKPQCPPSWRMHSPDSHLAWSRRANTQSHSTHLRTQAISSISEQWS